jgi:hypothetical protein
LKPIFKKHAKGVSRTPIPLDLCGKKVVALRSIDDIGVLPAGSYGLPQDPNFPLVDAIVQPDLLLQMIISEKKHKGAVAH